MGVDTLPSDTNFSNHILRLRLRAAINAAQYRHRLPLSLDRPPVCRAPSPETVMNSGLLASSSTRSASRDVPRLLDIENSFFGMQFPGYVREVVQTQRRKKEVRLIQGWVNVRATEVVPELESYNPRTWRPVPVISLFRYTKKALEDLPAQGDVDYLTKLMGSPPIWWEVLDWDE
ncbi:uncharacterized protein BXZ73DRAFT_79120 [Epithele typhae]|uniref:uncharacterized protein n=1 Tax=Epithele typhae TaxID=378194 RepID=UPI0020079EA7|nr:uncharacterized protein BXZ73DRAFT_79120 [Epithele typhae]KAH9924991.1 hypothetical protein BXZ73DRAFT_79120 [Epithele typhae]